MRIESYLLGVIVVLWLCFQRETLSFNTKQPGLLSGRVRGGWDLLHRTHGGWGGGVRRGPGTAPAHHAGAG